MITNGSVKVYAVYIDKARMMFYGDDYTTQYTLNVNEFAKQVNAFLSKDKNAFSVVNVCDISSSSNNSGDDNGDVKEVLGFNVDEMFNSDECLFFYYKCIHYAVVYDVYQCLLSGIKYDKVIHINCNCCNGIQYELGIYINHSINVHYSDDISTITAHITNINNNDNNNINYTNDIKVFICCNSNNNNTCNGYTAVHSSISNVNCVNVNVDVVKVNDTVSYWNELKVIAPVLLIDNV
jgi:hypothetical protein